MMAPLETRELARRLLANEAVAGNTSARTEPAAFRVCEKLRPPLCALAGVAGYRSLLSRALTLARAEGPSLSAVQVTADGVTAMQFETDVQNTTLNGVRVENIMGRMKGSQTTAAVLLSAHLDSVAASPGATDDASAATRMASNSRSDFRNRAPSMMPNASSNLALGNATSSPLS